MKTLFVSVVALLFTTGSFAQDTLLRFSIPPPGVLKPSYDIGKSPDPEIYPADSIPLFVIKGGGKSERIRPAKILELKTKGNNLLNVIPTSFWEEGFVYGVESMPRKYRKEGTYIVWEIYLIKDKAREAFKFLKDRGYME
jgi:hypothetical protein